MATYTAGCSQVGSFSYAKYFTLYVVLNDRDGNSATNQSVVDYNVYCQSSGSGSISANHQLYFELGGNVIRNENIYVNVKSPNAYIHIASGSMPWTHDNDGNKSIWVGASISATGGYGVSASIGTTFTLNRIPRYANFTEHYISSTGLNSISVRWNADSGCDWLQYSLNGGNWADISGHPVYTIRGLSPNKQYSIRTRIRRSDSQLWTESGYIYGTTKDIARISSLPDFNHGDNASISVTNPAGISSLNLAMKIAETQILNRTVVAGNNIIEFSDEELDILYKLYGSSSNLTATFVLTGSGYTNSKTCVITLKGNHKTIRINDNSTWKRGKIWTKMDNLWKRGVVYRKVNGVWKRGI